jgi:tetratricopeptide (TPR) repeat protein
MAIPNAERFRQRLMNGNDQDQYLREWATWQEITTFPPQEAVERLKQVVAVDKMSDAAYEHFWKSMVLINAAYSQRASLVGVSNLEEWQNRYLAYVNGSDPEAKQYDNFLMLWSKIGAIRKPPQQAPPFSPDELRFSQACLELSGKLAVLGGKAGPGLASKALIGELKSIIALYESLLREADVTNRARPQALDAIAEAQYCAGRISLIVRDYDQAQEWFQKSLELFDKLGDQSGEQCCRRQLCSLGILSTADVDAELRRSLETLTRKQMPAGSLDRAEALVSQIRQSLNADDKFALTPLIQEAIKELKQQGFPDDEKWSLEEALMAWIEGVPANLHGNDFLYRLSQVIQLYAAIWGARATMSEAGAIERLRGLQSLIQQLGLESFKADNDLQRRFASATARPLVARQDAAGE